MSNAYSLTVVDDNGELVLEIELHPDQCMPIIAQHVEALKIQAIVPEPEEVAVVVEPKTTRKYTKRKGGGSDRVVETKRGEAKPCCGSTGTRHFKTCKLAGAAQITKRDGSIDEVRSATEPLEEDQYHELRRAMHDREFQSAKYSLVNKLSPKEVNAAIRSKNYDDYIDNR